MDGKHDRWAGRLGVILAVAGSAIGFGNFLRFPGLAAQYGGGAFMIAYFCAFLLLGVPLSWLEWSIGRRGGALGGHSCSGIFYLLTRSRVWKYLGVLGILAPLGVAFYYVYLESWTLGYAYHCLVGDLNLGSSDAFGQFFNTFTGAAEDGAAFRLSESGVLLCFIISLGLNLYLLYRGVSRGIEWFCKVSMPVLLVTALVILLRVLTLGTPDATHPERSVEHGLGYMWNPDKTELQVRSEKGSWQTVEMLPPDAGEAEQTALRQRIAAEYPGREMRVRHVSLLQGLMNPDLWFYAAGQIFFSLSVGFGTVLCYASYVRRRENIALSSLTANAANECVEVGVAGMMIVPAAVSFLGVAAAAGAGTFGLGFNVLPQVFAAMPGGQFIGALFFILLFLAAVTSSLSQVQPSIAFMEEMWGISRRQSVVIITLIVLVGCSLVIWFTEGLLALDVLDFWMGQVSLYTLSILYIILCRFVLGTDRCMAELNRGEGFRLPPGARFVLQWVTPGIMLLITVAWLYKNIFEETCPQIRALLEGRPGAVIPVCWVLCTALVFLMMAHTSKRFHATGKRRLSER